MVALAAGLPILVTWWRSYRNIWTATFGIMCTGLLLAVLWSVSPWTMVLAAVPLTALYYTLRNTVSLETQTRQALFQLADILDARDPYTHGHSLRVGEYAEKLALAMGMSGEEAGLIYLSGRLHDIGKCAVRNEVLLKPGALDDEERAHMCIHPEVGSSMLNAFSLFKECAAFVRGHHERWDGKGYPDRLKGEDIPIGARVIAVADSYDAMTTTRPYRTALPREEAIRRLREGAGSQWDARAVVAFLAMLDAEPGQPEQPAPAEPVAKAA
jgi:putative nucleotidyltransferase with HDIG domain